jgi:hypothetical protein
MWTAVLVGWDPPLPHLVSDTRSLLVSQDRRHRFVTPGSLLTWGGALFFYLEYSVSVHLRLFCLRQLQVSLEAIVNSTSKTGTCIIGSWHSKLCLFWQETKLPKIRKALLFSYMYLHWVETITVLLSSYVNEIIFRINSFTVKEIIRPYFLRFVCSWR